MTILQAVVLGMILIIMVGAIILSALSSVREMTKECVNQVEEKRRSMEQLSYKLTVDLEKSHVKRMAAVEDALARMQELCFKSLAASDNEKDEKST